METILLLLKWGRGDVDTRDLERLTDAQMKTEVLRQWKMHFRREYHDWGRTIQEIVCSEPETKVDDARRTDACCS